jgi:UPF0755 protein
MKIAKIVVIMAFLFLALLSGFTYSVWRYVNLAFKPALSGNKCQIQISKGATTKNIANLLKKQNIIKSSLLFRIYIRFLAVDQNLKPGLYTFKGNENLSEVVYLLISGSQNTVPVTIPEGTTLSKIASILEDNSICKAEDFIESVSDPGLLGRVFSDWELIPQPEGLLFPETYFFNQNSSSKLVAERMLKLMKHQIDKIFGSSLPNGLNQYEGCILASIVEKEAVLDKDRPLIASVFYNRLRKRMKLESCATVLYALGAHKSRLLNEDLKIESPYNTYLNNGLPPTPISNFGIASMKAVAYPANTDYLFFVVNGQNGGHNFSKTINEHNRNKKEYFELRKQKNDK